MGSIQKCLTSIILVLSVLFCVGITACDTGEAPLLGTDYDSKQVGEDQSDGTIDGETTADTDAGAYTYSYNDDVLIPSTVNGETITIAANIYIPVEKSKGEIFPAIIFINSWALDEYEYAAQAKKFARKGYVVLSYSCRGWGYSGGTIQMGGDIDWLDFSAIIDWLGRNAPVDEQNMGVCGASLGGGGSLQAIAHDDRIKTAAALSSYIDQFRSMYSNETPRLFWANLLVYTGDFMGTNSPWMWDLYNYTMTGTNIDWVYDQTWEQSPINYIDAVNERNCPVYLSSNMGDYVFHSNLAVEYYNKLTVDHKYLDLNQGTHVSAEAPGILGYKNYVFDNVHLWFDRWLKGMDNGMAPGGGSAVITVEVKGTNERLVYGDLGQWPPKNMKEKIFFCAPGEDKNRGLLSGEENILEQVSTIVSIPLTGSTIGIPMVSPMLEQNGIPFTVPLWSMFPAKTMVYLTEPLEEALMLRGIPTVDLRIALSGPRGQIVAYLFDVDENNNAAFITHTFRTWWNAGPGEIMDVPLEFIFNAYDLEPGHRLALAIDTSDPEYGAPTKSWFEVSFVHDDEDQMMLTLPVE